MSQTYDDFEGSERLKSIGAAWFVSCAYCELVDPGHRNWENCSTVKSRYSTYANTRKFHRTWLRQVLMMNDKNLSKNSFRLSGGEIKAMAEKILSL